MSVKQTKQSGILRGWKEIASELRMGVSGAQECERRFGLPVYRMARGGAVYLGRRDLEDWKCRIKEKHRKTLSPP